MTARNFHGIGAIVFALRYGFRGIPTFLRLAWLPLIAGAVLAFLLIEAGANFDFGGNDASVGTGGAEFSVSRGFMLTAETWTAPMILLGLLLTAAAFFCLPALTAVTREAAGHQPRGGFLPVFGREERAYLAAILILVFFAALIAALVAVAFGLVEQIAPWLAVILGLVAFAAIVWAVVRVSLFPTHAAITARVAPSEAVSLTKGVFWKLLGTFALAVVIFWSIGIGVSILGLALGTVGGAILAQLPGVLLQLYNKIANAGLTSRIYSDLISAPAADPQMAETAPDIEA